MNCLKEILLYFRNYYTRKTHNNIFLVLLTVNITVTCCVIVLSVIDDDRYMIETCCENKGKISIVSKLWSIPVAARLLGLRVRIPPGAGMFVCCVVR